MGRLFGTDGARGIANSELTCALAMSIGRAAAYVLTKHSTVRPKVVIGKDTRVSSSMLEMALAAGMCSFGADVILVGFIPTPAVAYLIPEVGADAGVMISASHNPCDRFGYKLPDAIEDEIEAIVLDNAVIIDLPTGGDIGSIYSRHDYRDKYIEHVVSTVEDGTRLDGMKIVIDCANGSASQTAERIFTSMGAQCHMLHNRPDGVNINEHCGSTHMDDLIDYVNAHDVDLGLAFDGDSDRCLAVDEKGKLIDGDKLIAIFAKELKRLGQLNGNTAVVTVMTNIGFKKFARENDIDIAETGVGDRYVLENMLKNDYSIGGEQSGHIIFKKYATTGDGQLSGLQFAAAMARTGKKASTLASVMTSYPQVLVNVTVTNDKKELIKTDDDIKNAIKAAENQLGDNGRILVRASGTEPLIRVMIEGENIVEIDKIANRVADIIKEKAAK